MVSNSKPVFSSWFGVVADWVVVLLVLAGQTLPVSEEALLLGFGWDIQISLCLSHHLASQPGLAHMMTGTVQRKKCRCAKILKTQVRIHMSLLPCSLPNTRPAPSKILLPECACCEELGISAACREVLALCDPTFILNLICFFNSFWPDLQLSYPQRSLLFPLHSLFLITSPVNLETR